MILVRIVSAFVLGYFLRRYVIKDGKAGVAFEVGILLACAMAIRIVLPEKVAVTALNLITLVAFWALAYRFFRGKSWNRLGCHAMGITAGYLSACVVDAVLSF